MSIIFKPTNNIKNLCIFELYFFVFRNSILNKMERIKTIFIIKKVKGSRNLKILKKASGIVIIINKTIEVSCNIE